MNLYSCAIVGGGFSGLAVSNFILNYAPKCVIHLYDLEYAPGLKGASAAAGGLMHPFTPKGKLIWKGLEGFEMSENLIDSCQPYVPNNQVISKCIPILRPCFKAEDFQRWQATETIHPELLKIYDRSEVISITGDNPSIIGGALFRKSLIVDSPVYLKSLWQRVVSLSPHSTWSQFQIQSKNDLLQLSQTHDAVVVAAGAGMQELWSTDFYDENKQIKLPFKYVRGQNLIFEANDLSGSIGQKLQVPLLKGEYIVPAVCNYSGKERLISGATHEYAENLSQLSDQPDIDKAKALLLDKLTAIYPDMLKHYNVVSCNAGIRVMTERSNLGKIPVIERFSPSGAYRSAGGKSGNTRSKSNTWLMGGLGARGLIHHALAAHTLARAILEDDETLIPAEMRIG